MACIAVSSYEISALHRHYAVLSGHSLLTFQKKLSIQSSSVQKSKRENTARLKSTDNTFFFRTYASSNFLKKLALFPFSGKEAPNLLDPLD